MLQLDVLSARIAQDMCDHAHQLLDRNNVKHLEKSSQSLVPNTGSVLESHDSSLKALPAKEKSRAQDPEKETMWVASQHRRDDNWQANSAARSVKDTSQVLTSLPSTLRAASHSSRTIPQNRSNLAELPAVETLTVSNIPTHTSGQSITRRSSCEPGISIGGLDMVTEAGCSTNVSERCGQAASKSKHANLEVQGLICPDNLSGSILDRSVSQKTTALIEPATATAPHSIKTRDPYRNPIILPHHEIPASKKTKLFPHSGTKVPKEHIEAFPDVVDVFKQNLERQREIGLACNRLDFRLWMAGPSESDLCPSIVVICQKGLLSNVEAILHSKHIADQCNIVVANHGLKNFLARRPPNRDRDSRPQFKLHCFACETPRTLLSGIFLACKAFLENTDEQIWCGSKIIDIESGSRSTIACILKIGEDRRGLTTAHGFEGTDATKDAFADSSGTALDRPGACALMVPEDETKMMANLDWALVEIHDHHLLTAVSAHSQGLPKLGHIASCNPREEREILILSSNLAQPKTGILLCDITYSISLEDKGKVEYWSVELADRQGIVDLLGFWASS